MPVDRDDWTQFLGRIAPRADRGASEAELRGKTVVITGAGGFIGSALARAIHSLSPRRMVFLDIAEHGLHELHFELGDTGSAPVKHYVVGDVCDPALLTSLFTQNPPDIVFHAAAAKHVWLMEHNPFTAARTNAIGTARALEAANTAGAEHFVLISTDKAVDPLSAMGAAKRIAELAVLANTGPVRAKAIRLGNVLGSTGSVVPLFRRQIAQGGPLTITDAACMRYFLSVDEVVQHLLSVLLVRETAPLLIARSGPPHSIVELAHFMVRHAHLDQHAIPLQSIGLRPGEKLTESLLAKDESAQDLDASSLQSVIAHAAQPALQFRSFFAQLEDAVHSRNLPALLLAIARMLPNYQPSSVLAGSAEATTASLA